jgi:hypothetical protein
MENKEPVENYKRDFYSEKLIIEYEKKEILDEINNDLKRKPAIIEVTQLPKKRYENKFQSDTLPF